MITDDRLEEIASYCELAEAEYHTHPVFSSGYTWIRYYAKDVRELLTALEETNTTPKETCAEKAGASSLSASANNDQLELFPKYDFTKNVDTRRDKNG